MFVTFEVSNCGMVVSFEQEENMYAMLVTFLVSLGCKQPSNEVAVLREHFPPASKKAFMEGSVFSIVNVGQTFLSPR